MAGESVTRQTIRLLRMINLLKNRRMTRAELARKFGVSDRTVYRDLIALEETGVAVGKLDSGGTYWIEPETFMRPLTLTESEMAALWLASRAFRGVLGDDLDSALDKLSEVVSHARKLRKLEGAVEVAPVGEDQSDLFQAVLRSIHRSRRLEIVYSSLQGQQPTTRKLDPWGVFMHQNAWYVVGHDHLRDDRRTFKLARVLSFTELEESYDRPAEFSVEEAMFHNFDAEGATPIPVRIRVDAEVKRLLTESPAHPSQEIHGDEVRYQVRAPLRMLRWILGLGSACVLEPPELRQAVLAEATRKARDHM
ncbi:MAG: WYL domain-containing protein [Candidatus Eremiobacterota bacterium]